MYCGVVTGELAEPVHKFACDPYNGMKKENDLNKSFNEFHQRIPAADVGQFMKEDPTNFRGLLRFQEMSGNEDGRAQDPSGERRRHPPSGSHTRTGCFTPAFRLRQRKSNGNVLGSKESGLLYKSMNSNKLKQYSCP